MVLAGLGLGSFTFAVWVQEYRWLFLATTIVLLAFAFYKTYRDRNKTGPWSHKILYATTVLSLGLVVYTLLYR
jgi:type II secretory pathway component PulF